MHLIPTLRKLSVRNLELDIMIQYIGTNLDKEALMTNDPKGYRLENCADMTPFEGYDLENLPATIPLMASQLHTLEIH
jgi:hypothetical protein